MLRCSFCRKDQRKVRAIIAGPTTYICNECVEICAEILVEDGCSRTRDAEPTAPPVTPGKLKIALSPSPLESRVSALEAQVAALLQRLPPERSA